MQIRRIKGKHSLHRNKNWELDVPASRSPTGKRYRRYFKTMDLAVQAANRMADPNSCACEECLVSRRLLRRWIQIKARPPGARWSDHKELAALLMETAEVLGISDEVLRALENRRSGK